ncbi:uncharacterized protein AB675_9531 [Cyphellophora attinorum]|uniref:Integral membrane protein n=1 Tax=Cyphellophora attinorum TaxID=1664694 RepID=A0A0N1P2D3_9EURO|nr:uncharacterized protein AB675_9531 [Phialophora attinorum]KPI42265.1 hypothetical protein AB675_9531 [Phialophora attinorum]
MPHPIFMYSALGMGLILGGFGLNGSFRPDAHLVALGFPAHTDPKAQKLNYALMRIWGIRNIAVSALVTLIWSTGNERLMAQALCAVLPIPIVDGFVSRALIGGGEGQHWSFPPVMVVVIAGLFGFFD